MTTTPSLLQPARSTQTTFKPIVRQANNNMRRKVKGIIWKQQNVLETVGIVDLVQTTSSCQFTSIIVSKMFNLLAKTHREVSHPLHFLPTCLFVIQVCARNNGSFILNHFVDTPDYTRTTLEQLPKKTTRNKRQTAK